MAVIKIAIDRKMRNPNLVFKRVILFLTLISIGHSNSYGWFISRGVLPIRGGYSQLNTSNSLLALLSSIENCGNVDELYQICENIPAIKICKDKQIRISLAETYDGILAVRAIQRIANLSVNNLHSSREAIVIEDIESDRRYSQLTDCVDVCVNSLSISDLSRYLWSISVLGIGEESQINPIFKEYQKRLSSITVDELITIIWTVGCVKDTLGLTNHTLMNTSLTHISHYFHNNPYPNIIHPSSLVNILWSMAIYGRNDIIISSYCIQNLSSNLHLLSATDITILLWTCSKLRLFDEYFISNLLSELKLRIPSIEVQQVDFSVLCDSLRSIFYEQIYNPKYHPNGNILSYQIRQIMYSILLVLPYNLSHISHINGIISIFRTASSMSLCTHRLIHSVLEHLNGIFFANGTLSAPHAASVLESLGVIQSRMSIIQDPIIIANNHNNNEHNNINDNNNMNINTNINNNNININNNNNNNNIIDNSLKMSKYDMPLNREELRRELSNPSWHRIAGRLSAICATTTQNQPPLSSSSTTSTSTQSQLLHTYISTASHIPTKTLTNALSSGNIYIDRIQLLNACWGVAELGHQYRALLRAVRKSVQFSLHELDAQSLARLSIAVAEEETGVTVGGDKGITGAKLDREFVDQVALMSLRRAPNMSPTEQIGCLIAVAKLGRISGIGWRNIVSTNTPSIEFSEYILKILTTSELIPLLWSLGRLPGGVVSIESVKRVQSEIHKRDLSSKAVPTNDILLLIRTLTNAHASKDVTLESSKQLIGDALLSHLKVWEQEFHNNNNSNDIISQNIINNNEVTAPIIEENPPLSQQPQPQQQSQKATLKIIPMIMNLQEKCEILQSFIDLKWYDKEIFRLSSKYLQVQQQQLLVLGSSINCEDAFDLGRLEELLKIYNNLPLRQDSSHRYHLGKKILSRFFHGIIGWSS